MVMELDKSRMTPAPEQPFGVEIKMADGVFIKQIVIPKAYTYVPQHSHTYDHTSMLAVGAVAVWQDEAFLGRRQAPCGMTIGAGVKHTFMSLEDSTVIYCIHRIDRMGEIEIAEEHQLI